MNLPAITLSVLNQACPQVLAFLQQTRRQLYGGLLNADEVPADLQHFAATYLGESGRLWLARDDAGELLGCIAYRAYDHRFANLDYRQEKVVEVVRLFVCPSWRRRGLASTLFAALREEARRQGISLLYLHSHPFLPGAIAFWQRQGFHLTQVDADPPWHTTHMQLALDR